MLLRTPLYNTHLALKGRMVEFGGWELPVSYSSILEEHKAVRLKAGLFDVSHMGEIFVEGSMAFPYIQRLLTNDFTSLSEGGCRYSLMCNPSGGTVDDVIVYKFNQEKYLIVVNASNIDKDFEWMQKNAEGFELTITNASKNYAQLALQGPLAQQILAPLCEGELPQRGYTFAPELCVSGKKAIVSRTGYTGEDGFEIYCQAEDVEMLHAAIMQSGEGKGLLPCGLGSRDTLRFEASMPLYGHELGEGITPLEAGLQFAVKLNKLSFVGRDALIFSPIRMRIGLKLTGKGIAREHANVYVDGRLVGQTTSGGPAPTLGANYAMALVEADVSDASCFEIMVRDKLISAVRTPMPFYKRTK